MTITVITIFPRMIREFLGYSLVEKAISKGLLQVEAVDLRDFSGNKHRKVDDRPFGGGAGMVLTAPPLFNTVEHLKAARPGRVILFSAYGRVLTQKRLKRLSREPHLILICGRYDGVDQRFIDAHVDEEISLGKYVLMGGEVAAEALIEGVARMIPGVVANPDSVTHDSFFWEEQTAFPQYTQPREFRGLKVPEILLSGNHEEIEQWRKNNQKKRR